MFYKYIWNNHSWLEGQQETKAKHLDIACCRRDSAALQVLLSADEDFLLTISSDPLFWKGGPLKIARIEVETEPFLTTEVKLIGLIEDDDRCLKSDLLLEQNEIFVKQRKIQQVWVECHASAETPPGIYKGKIRLFTHTMFEDERLERECTFSLTVKDYLLPEPSDYTFYLDLWQHNSNIARKYQVGLWSKEHFEILDRYLHSLSQLGQKAVTLVVSEIPWSGQHSHRDRRPSDLFEYSMVRVSRRTDGSFRYDFSALDEYVALAEKHGICAEIELFGLLNIWQDSEAGYGSIVENHPDGIRIRYFDESSGTFCFMRRREDLDAYIQALEKHFIETGRIDRVRVLADEPKDFELFQERLAALRQTAPSFKYKVAIQHVEFIRRNMEGIHDYVPVLNCVAGEHSRLKELRPQIPGNLLYYVCCYPEQPNTFICSPALESRVIPWLVEKLQLDGFLRWNYTVWPDQPFEQLSYRAPIWKAGDMNFVYPGANGKPILSLRYKWLQRGIRDYELMQILKASGQAAQVEAALNDVFRFRNPGELSPEANRKNSNLYSLEPADYDRLIVDL
ncbi:DUF4091 domain-containing protein [Paenactinomyces guangxiensis]|uniref:DUF4091 domain-containing protein n=2 Tax=Paenactinomyces guangxiensis TaxID=1490290 RepID=A0A7W2A7L4_9BACL|nr:DUF4091 domain-containing protein [Paenactinomyces guangxiensis]MBH8591770.1 DUF4091 domain-containing protein [Paenactinomyces guangxiensis]